MSALTKKECQALEEVFDIRDHNIARYPVDDTGYDRLSATLPRQCIIDRLNNVFGVGGFCYEEVDNGDSVTVSVRIPERNIVWAAVADKMYSFGDDNSVRVGATLALQRLGHLIGIGSYLNRTYVNPPFIHSTERIPAIEFVEGSYPSFDVWKRTPSGDTADLFLEEGIAEYKNGALLKIMRNVLEFILVNQQKVEPENDGFTDAELIVPFNQWVLSKGGAVFTILEAIPVDVAKQFFDEGIEHAAAEIIELAEIMSPEVSIVHFANQFDIDVTQKSLHQQKSITKILKMLKWVRLTSEAANNANLVVDVDKVWVMPDKVWFDMRGLDVIIDYISMMERADSSKIDKIVDKMDYDSEPKEVKLTTAYRYQCKISDNGLLAHTILE